MKERRKMYKYLMLFTVICCLAGAGIYSVPETIAAEEAEKKNPFKAVGGLFGKKKKKEVVEDADKEQLTEGSQEEKKKGNPLKALGGLFGKGKKENDGKEGSKNPFASFANLLSGKMTEEELAQVERRARWEACEAKRQADIEGEAFEVEGLDCGDFNIKELVALRVAMEGTRSEKFYSEGEKEGESGGLFGFGNQQDGNRNVFYAGYSKKFLDTKALIAEGRAVDAYDRQMESQLIKAKRKKKKKKKDEIELELTEEPLYKEPNFLFALEQGLIALDAERKDDAVKYFDTAENILEIREENGTLTSAVGSVGNLAASLLGFGEAGKYQGEAFERIMMLNYKSMAYLLDGERKAYNVTRRAINWQNIEKRNFDKEMADVNDKVKEKEKEIDEKAKQKAGNKEAEEEQKEELADNDVVENKEEEAETAKNEIAEQNIFAAILSQYEASKEKALQVPNAFVNPFGFYLSGIVLEYESYDNSDFSSRDNARIAYGKALELKPDSEVIKQALTEIEKPAPKGKRLVHIIMADGFAPEKKVLRFNYAIEGTTVAVKLPIYEVDASSVSRVEVQNSQGKIVTELKQIADMDAIALRHEYDSLPKQHFNLLFTVARSVYENKALDEMGTFGAIFKVVREETSNPDMRSWMTLPKQIMAARMFLPKEETSLQLVAYDTEGNELSRRGIELNPDNHNFVYARSIENTLYMTESEKLWVPVR